MTNTTQPIEDVIANMEAVIAEEGNTGHCSMSLATLERIIIAYHESQDNLKQLGRALQRLRDDVEVAHVDSEGRNKDCAVCSSLNLADAALRKVGPPCLDI